MRVNTNELMEQWEMNATVACKDNLSTLQHKLTTNLPCIPQKNVSHLGSIIQDNPA